MWGLASTTNRRRLVCGRRGSSAILTTAAMAVFLAVTLTTGLVTRIGMVPSEQLVHYYKRQMKNNIASYSTSLMRENNLKPTRLVPAENVTEVTR